jgi:hypothetical protein
MRVSVRGVASGWSGVSERGGALGTSTVRRGGGDDEDEERPGGDLGQKQLSVDLEGYGAYIETPLLSRVIFPTETKGPLVSGCVTTRD